MKKLILGLIVCIAIILRFVYLDQDVPSYYIGGINQEDEVYYTLLGLTHYNIDEDKTVDGYTEVYSTPYIIAMAPLTYLSIHLFGLNYWALRLPVVLLSILTIIILIRCLNLLQVNKKVLYFLGTYLLFDFYFFLFSRFQTPQIYSITGISIILFAYIKCQNKPKLLYLLLGCLSVALFTFVYIYNTFIFAGLGLYLLIISIKQKEFKPILLFAVGSTLSIIIYQLILYFFWNIRLTDILAQLTEINGGVQKKIGLLNLLIGLKNAVFQIINTNFFRYNLAFLYIFLIILFITTIQIFKKLDKLNTLLISIILMLVLQSIFIQSYPFKKHIVLIPICILFIGYNFETTIKHFTSNNKKIQLIVFSCIAILFCLHNFRVNKSSIYWSSLAYGYMENTTTGFDILNILVLALVVLYFFIQISKKLPLLQFEKVFLLLFIIPSLFLISKYTLIEKKYSVSKTLKKFRNEIEGKNVVGDYAHAYEYYTHSVPILNPYDFKDDNYNKVVDSLLTIKKGNYLIRQFFANDSLYQMSNGDTLQVGQNYNLIQIQSGNATYYRIGLFKAYYHD